MKKIVKFLTALLLANVFATFPAFANTALHINPNQFSNVAWQNVSPSETLRTSLSERQRQAFTTSFAGTASPIAAYRIPAGQGALQIKITSPVLDQNLFVPNVLVLDSLFNVAATYPSSEFKLYEERGMQPHHLAVELNLTPTTHQDYIYLLLYTTQQDLNKTTMIPHPAKSYAKATGKEPPALKDIEVKHSLNGRVDITVNNTNSTRFIGLQNSLFSSNKSSQHAQEKKQPVTNVVNSDVAITMPVDKDTEIYFTHAVKKALDANDINKALNLVNEAEKLGLTSPRQIFLKQVSSK